MWQAFVDLLSNMIHMMYDWTAALGMPSYGVAVILFTVILRLLLFPLNLLQSKNSRAMQLMQPKQKQLQQQYKNNPEILNREMQALYRKYNVNPLSGCLPMLVQMPFLFALFSAMRNFQYTGEGASFLWIPSLSEPDPTGIVLPVIVGLSSYLQSKLSMEAQPPAGEQQKTMNAMMLYGMPVMIGWSTRTFASGLAIYWSVFNILGFLLQIAINSLSSKSQEKLKADMDAEERRLAQEVIEEEEERKRDEQQKREEDRQRSLRNREKKKNTGSSKDGQAGSTRGKPLNFDE